MKLGTENSIASAISSRAESSALEMVKAIRVHELGGPEVLKWEDVDIGEPKEGEVRVKNKAIGLNFIDVYFRKGVYKAATLPFTPGMEAAGVVTAVGPGVNGRKVGDFVAYAGNPMGSYTEEQILPADKVVPVPPSVDPTIAASVLLKGMTAQFLVRRCYKVEPGHIVLVHAAAGGVGSLLCQWANSLGATVIGTVSTKEKAAQAKEDGCHHVIIYKEEDFVARVNEITSGNGVNVVYDSVGKDTFQGSLACLKTRGYMVSFGQSSGTPDPVPLSALAAKSLFLTRPSLMQYTIIRDELLEAAKEPPFHRAFFKPPPLPFFSADFSFSSGATRGQLRDRAHAAFFFSPAHCPSTRVKGGGATRAHDSDDRNRRLSPLNCGGEIELIRSPTRLHLMLFGVF